MSQIILTHSQRRKAYEDLIASCADRAALPGLLDKAAKLYGAIDRDTLISLLDK